MRFRGKRHSSSHVVSYSLKEVGQSQEAHFCSSHRFSHICCLNWLAWSSIWASVFSAFPWIFLLRFCAHLWEGSTCFSCRTPISSRSGAWELTRAPVCPHGFSSGLWVLASGFLSLYILLLLLPDCLPYRLQAPGLGAMSTGSRRLVSNFSNCIWSNPCNKVCVYVRTHACPHTHTRMQPSTPTAKIIWKAIIAEFFFILMWMNVVHVHTSMHMCECVCV